MSRIAIFIDAGYLSNLLKAEYPGGRIDYGKLAVLLAGGVDILRTYYYNCLPYQSQNPTPEENDRFSKMQGFFEALKRLPRFEVRQGRLEYRGTNKETGKPIFEQKRVDVLLAVDLISISSTRQITHAAIVTGDSDFVPAIAAAKGYGVMVSLWHGGNVDKRCRPHNDLLSECDERYAFTKEMIAKIAQNEERNKA